MKHLINFNKIYNDNIFAKVWVIKEIDFIENIWKKKKKKKCFGLNYSSKINDLKTNAQKLSYYINTIILFLTYIHKYKRIIMNIGIN